MTLPIVRTDVYGRIGEALALTYAKADGAAGVDARIAEAWDSVRSAALNHFTAASFDALTADTVPPEARRHIISLAAAALASGSNHPDYIDAAADEAKQWRSFLAGGTVRCFDDILSSTATTSGGAQARVGAPTARVFDSTDTRGGLRRRVTIL
jgi:hypothetical protein